MKNIIARSLRYSGLFATAFALASCASSTATETPASTEEAELSVDANAAPNTASTLSQNGNGTSGASNLSDNDLGLDNASDQPKSTANAAGNSLDGDLGNNLGNNLGKTLNNSAANPALSLNNSQGNPIPGGLDSANQGGFDPDKTVASTEPANPLSLGNYAAPATNTTVAANGAVPATNPLTPPPPTNAASLAQNTGASQANAAMPPPQNSANSGGDAIPAPQQPAVVGVPELTPEEREHWKAASAKLRDLTPGEAPSEYVVQHGDTLWDIADQLLDDYSWWPKLWTINAEIANPHLIHPGQKLVFEPSDGDNIPALAVRDLGTATPVSSDAAFVTRLPNYEGHPWNDKTGQLIDLRELGADPGIELFGATLASHSFSVMIPGYLSGSNPDSVGEIVRVGDGGLTTTKGAIAYADMDTRPNAGERFLAVRPVERGINPNGEKAFGSDLYLYTGVLGVVKVHQSGRVSLVVEDTNIGVNESDVLVPFKNIYQVVDPVVLGRAASVKAEVLAVSGIGRSIGSAGQVIMLDIEDGSAAPGDDIDLYMPAGGITNFDGAGLDATLVGKARVLEANSDSITAYVINSTREISVGARTWAEF